MMRKTIPVLFLAAVMSLVFWKVIFHNEFTLLVGADMSSSYYPWFDVASYWLKRGVLLLWDPYVYAGKFNMGELQPGLYYPLNWVFMLLPSKTGGASLDGMQALIVLDYFLAALFTYLLARSLRISRRGACVAAVSFAIGGFNAHIYGYLNVLSGFVWMPVVLMLFMKSLQAADRVSRIRNALGSGLLLGLSFLAGHHIPVIHTGFLLLLYCVFTIVSDWSRTSIRQKAVPLAVLGAVACTALLATAFQWIPSAEWARHVYRWVGFGGPVKWGEHVPYSVLQAASRSAPQDALSFVFPYIGLSGSYYVGAVMLFLALVALLFVRKKETAFFSVTAISYFFLGWGQYSALHGWANTFVPGLWFAREVFYYMVPFQICLALLAGWGLDHLAHTYSSSLDRRLQVFIRRIGWIMALAVVSLATMAAGLYMYGGLHLDHPFVRALGSLASYIAVLGILLFLLQTGRISPAWFANAAAALLVVDLVSHFSADIPTKSRPPGASDTYVREYWREPPAVSFLQEEQRKGRFRIDDPEHVFPPNYGDVWRLDATMGHGATALVDYFEFRGVGWGPGSNASALLNVGYFLSPTPLQGWESVPGGAGVLYRNPRAVPRAFVAPRFRSFADDSEMLTWLASPAFNPWETVLLRAPDIRRIDNESPGQFVNDEDGVTVRPVTRQTAADKAIGRTSDAEAQRRMFVFQLPWGWSAGDETILLLSPERAGTECFLVVDYLAGGSGVSRLSARLEASGTSTEIPFELDGSDASKSALQREAVSLGRLDRRNYRLSLTVPEGCTARIDSIRVTAHAPLAAQDGAGTAQLTSFEPNRLTLKAEIRRPSFLVLSEVYYPGWEARVDGKPAPLLKADYILRAVPLTPGEHSVELRFRPRTFIWGLAISALGLAGIACLSACPQFVLGSDCRDQAKARRNSNSGI
jgi:Bacterial membrane protein YfhO